MSGSVAALLQVDPGHEAAVAAALGWAADAVAADTVEAAAGAVSLLREDDAGRAVLLVGRVGAAGRPRDAGPSCRSGPAGPATRCTCPEGLRPAIDQLLDRVALVDGTAAALELAGRACGPHRRHRGR